MRRFLMREHFQRTLTGFVKTIGQAKRLDKQLNAQTLIFRNQAEFRAIFGSFAAQANGVQRTIRQNLISLAESGQQFLDFALRFGRQAQFFPNELAQLQEFIIKEEDTDDIAMFETQYHQLIAARLRTKLKIITIFSAEETDVGCGGDAMQIACNRAVQ